MKQLISWMRPYKWKMTLCFLAVLVANAAQILNPVIAAIIIDDFLMGDAVAAGLYSVTGLAIGYAVIETVSAAAGIYQVQSIAKVSQNILHTVRTGVFDRIMHMSMRALDKNGTGRLITRATNDVETINEFYSDVFLNLFKDVFLLIGIVIIMFILDVRLALISFIGIPLIFLISFSLKSMIRKNFKRIKALIGRINGFMAENINGMRLVVAFRRQKEKYREFSELNDDYYHATMTQVFLNTFLRPSMEIINNFLIALLIAFACGRVSNSLLDVGILYAFTTYVKRFFDPINDIAEKYTTIQSALVSVDRINEVLHEQGCEEETTEGICGPVQGEITFEHVWFAYEGENWVLKDVSFTLNINENIAFVGATGAGKSTIIHLICGYYPINKGRILIDGHSIEEWNIHALRRGIVSVQQDVFLFSGDLKMNLSLYSEHSDTELRRALGMVQAQEFALEQPVMEQGLNFSTGERQILSFARAVVAEPAVLILDEATAHIDSNTELKVQEAIAQIAEHHTCIFIAHRLSTIRHCDKIILLDHGQVLEMGSHAELYRKKGAYYRLMQGKNERSEVCYE